MPMSFGEPEDAIVESSPTPPKPEKVEEEFVERAATPEAPEAPEEAESATATEPEVEKVDPKKAPGRLEALAKLTHEANNGEAAEEAEPVEAADAVEAEAEVPDEKKPETPVTDEDKADEELRKGMQEKTAKRFSEVLADRKKAREDLAKLKPEADFGATVLAECKKANLHPAAFGQWTKLGIDFQMGNPEALDVMRGMLEAAEAADRKANPGRYEMPKVLKDKVEAHEIMEETAKEIWEEQKKTQRAARATPAPLKETTPPPAPPAPETSVLDRGIADIKAEGEKVFKTEWSKVEAMAYEKVKAQGAATQEVILDRMKRAVTDVKNELAAKQRKAAAPPLQSIRPSSRTTGTQPKTGRESILAKLSR